MKADNMAPRTAPPPVTRADQIHLPFLGDGDGDAARRMDVAASEPVVGPGRAQRRRRAWVKWSGIISILVPTLLAGIYFGVVASDQYAVEVRFAVRGAHQAPSPDLLGMFVNTAVSGTTTSDSYIVMDFIRSREIIDNLPHNVDIRTIYSKPDVDYVSRLDPNAPIEDVQKYWIKMIDIGFDTASQVIALKVRAFTPDDATRLTKAVVARSEELINGLSERARRDAIAFAKGEIEGTEDRLRRVRTELTQFRDLRQELDPVKTAEAQLTQITRLEIELAETKARIKTLGSFVDKNAPNVEFLRTKVDSLEQQLELERRKVGQGKDGISGNPTLSRALSDYERLQIELEFAQKAYVTALSALERARLDATQQQRYLAVFVNPKLPELAEYPKRIMLILTVFGVSIILWAIGVLVAYAVRDHTV